ncbi:pap-like poly(A) polymerase [Niveomyces insectorum RCEF 264]|uniref:Poly(A) polymerase n=1 Tax=Niveomyces insectorum RCEF 264 TaxID=1081102 RepID=A0A167Y743_9HYPO|nr:pap-like poly(A) polymerase [Niveomyces insectorum RCEF 264]
MNFDKQYGVTPPLSTEMPTAEQRRATDALLEELRQQGTFESTAETQKRFKVLESLRIVADAFVKRVAKEKAPDNPTLPKDAVAKIFTYGSFRLGVYMPGSDIDTLVVAPKYVTREDYFRYFPEMLQSMSPPGAITDLTAVEDAFVPIIKFEYSGISIDLIFSRVLLTQLPSDEKWGLTDSNLLRGLDEAELRSVNGTRVTDEILTLVPEQRTFRDALRAIKLWAQRRAIYANIMGFPGGVAWAMMVARVCQLYPKATGAVIVSKFFGIILRWPWPNPVLLKPIEDGPLPVRVWNPKVYRGDQFHIMPIITPAYPSMCATYNISQSSLAIIKRELERASEISQMIIGGRRQWKDLFVKHTFFTSDFKYYISVTTASTDREAQNVWSGFVESKVRVLVQGLERHESIALARPFNKGYERTHLCKSKAEIEAVQNGSLEYQVKTADNEAANANAENGAGAAATEGPNGTAHTNGTNGTDAATTADGAKPTEAIEVFTLTHYIGIELVEGARSLDLSFQVDEFKELCFNWDKYKEKLVDVCTLSIQHVRNFGLPDDVFEPNEVRPTKPVRVPRSRRRDPSAAVANGNQKRKASEENAATAPAPKRQQPQAQQIQQSAQPQSSQTAQQPSATVAAAAAG